MKEKEINNETQELIEIKEVNLVSKEQKTSEKTSKNFVKLYVDDGTDKNRLLMIYKKELLEPNRLAELDENNKWMRYDFKVKKRGDFFYVSDWERLDCSNCQRNKITKLLFAVNNRNYIIKEILKGQINLWKVNKINTVPIELMDDVFKNIIEELDKDNKKQKETLDLIKDTEKVKEILNNPKKNEQHQPSN